MLAKFFLKLLKLWVKCKCFYYKLSSDTILIGKSPVIKMPLFIQGKGQVLIDNTVIFGQSNCPNFYTGYNYIEARNKNTKIQIQGQTSINNCFSIIAEGDGVFIGRNCLIGFNVTIMDSDFHDLNPTKRLDPTNIKTKKVIIEDNIFIGSNVLILRGVHIGKNSVIAAGSVVTKSFPENCVIAGNPAKIIKMLEV